MIHIRREGGQRRVAHISMCERYEGELLCPYALVVNVDNNGQSNVMCSDRGRALFRRLGVPIPKEIRIRSNAELDNLEA